MSTAAKSRTAHEENQSKLRADADARDKENKRDEMRLAEIKIARERPDHLDKLAASDTGAISAERKLADEQADLERKISARRLRAEQLRNDAKTLQPTIEAARVAEAVATAAASAVAWENRATAISPILDAFAAELKTFETGRAALEAAIRDLPEWGQIWLGKFFVQNVVDKFNSALFNELSRVVVARGKSSGEFVSASEQIFENVERVLATIRTTAEGSGPGRKMYRAIGGVNGLAGGLTVHDGDLICLPVDDAETKKLVASGALIAEEGN
jgi:hypothetical protein